MEYSVAGCSSGIARLLSLGRSALGKNIQVVELTGAADSQDNEETLPAIMYVCMYIYVCMYVTMSTCRLWEYVAV